MGSEAPHNELIGWEVREHIGILTVSNPPENYLKEPDFISIDTLDKHLNTPGLKGIIITGHGKHFSAGGDTRRLFDLIRMEVDLSSKMQAGNRLLQRLEECDLPRIAAIRGVCFGGGLELALTCHIRLAGENSLFAFPETGLNLIPGLGGTLRLPRLTSTAYALPFILSGEVITAEEALRCRLVDQLVPARQVLDQAFSLMKRITAGNRPEVIRATIRVLRNAETLSAEEAIREETRLFTELAVAEFHRRTSEEHPA